MKTGLPRGKPGLYKPCLLAANAKGCLTMQLRDGQGNGLWRTRWHQSGLGPNHPGLTTVALPATAASSLLTRSAGQKTCHWHWPLSNGGCSILTSWKACRTAASLPGKGITVRSIFSSPIKLLLRSPAD